MAQTAAEALIEKGRKIGRKIGREISRAEGIVECKREVVLYLLHLRFQGVPEVLAQRIAAIKSVSDLDALLEQVMTAENLEDLQV